MNDQVLRSHGRRAGRIHAERDRIKFREMWHPAYELGYREGILDFAEQAYRDEQAALRFGSDPDDNRTTRAYLALETLDRDWWDEALYTKADPLDVCEISLRVISGMRADLHAPDDAQAILRSPAARRMLAQADAEEELPS
jgi:hypothetical protein